MITKNELIENAEELTALTNNLKVANSLLTSIKASFLEGNTVSAYVFFSSDDSEHVIDSLDNIADSVQQISNNICPED